MKIQGTKRNNKTTIFIVVGVALAILIAVACLLLFGGTEVVQRNDTDIREITLVGYPNKMAYFVGEEFNPSGARVQLITENMEYTSFVDHEELSFSGFDSSAPAENQVITVTYKGFTATFTVTIKEIPVAEPTLVSIRLSDNFVSTYSLSWWTTYGPVFDNVELICTYSDGSEKRVPMRNMYCLEINTNVNEPTTVDIPIEYSDAGIIATTVVTVTITE